MVKVLHSVAAGTGVNTCQPRFDSCSNIAVIFVAGSVAGCGCDVPRYEGIIGDGATGYGGCCEDGNDGGGVGVNDGDGADGANDEETGGTIIPEELPVITVD
ncbi:hypothetical protein DERP_013839 [Dermatophagoides pteronyssinus]|uniref:Uncharacterized protein n=1 Tax=Dermatophagoides pteronyssinus TaxID=6956 RepID=A0ABQ8J2X4_DERPT|nr:hypothetical protein DERP_013839 [Dermatophagoides pteronyssinus]